MHNNLNDSFLTDQNEAAWKNNLKENPRHRWYSYKEGFSSKIVERAIQETEISKNDVIIDPFNGGGTTTLTASLYNLKSVGIEVNPFSKFVSETKIQSVNPELFKGLIPQILEGIKEGKQSPLQNFSTFSEPGKNNKWLFNNSILKAFSGGLEQINLLNPSVRKILKLALISAAMRNSNASKDGKCLKYKKSWQNLQLDENSFIEAFIKKTNEIFEDLETSYVPITPTLLEGDVRKVLKKHVVPNFKLCITSPPYLNSFDYTDIYRPELFLGEFINSNFELQSLRRRTLRSHVEMKIAAPRNNSYGVIYDQMLKDIVNHSDLLWDKQIPFMIQGYFEDMENVLYLLKEKLQKNGQVWIIVSNSAYVGIEIQVDLIIAEIGLKCGLFLKEIGVLRYVKKRKTKYSANIDYLRESVVIFTKEPKFKN